MNKIEEAKKICREIYDKLDEMYNRIESVFIPLRKEIMGLPEEYRELKIKSLENLSIAQDFILNAKKRLEEAISILD
jgi:hypothetical protein